MLVGRRAWETERAVIKGRPLKVYKRLPASLREFWEGTEVSQARRLLSRAGRAEGDLRGRSELARPTRATAQPGPSLAAPPR